MEIKTMTDVDHDLAKGWREGVGTLSGLGWGWKTSPIVGSLCGNTVLMICFWPGTVLLSQLIGEAGLAGWERAR